MPPPLIRATEVLPAGRWPGETALDRLVLNYDERHRRRLRYVAEGGTTFLLDLPRAVVLRAGDGLRLENGSIVRIEASPEQLIEITAADTAALIKLAWHIGNRHLPAQLEPERILIREDAVIENMLRGLGATIKHVLEPFTPEAGAYDNFAAPSHQAHAHDGTYGPDAHSHPQGPGQTHQHSHDDSHHHGEPHEHDHDHSHGLGHTHDHGQPRQHGDSHGPGLIHSHGGHHHDD
jgi:urease accessory protein